MKIQQLIEEQAKQLDSRIQSLIFYTQDINKDEIIDNEQYKNHFELVRESTRSYSRKLIEALGEEIEDCVPQGWCTKENEHKSMDADLVVAILKLMRLKLKEILSNIT